MIVDVENGTISDDLFKEFEGYNLSRREIQDFICDKKLCDICGENLWIKKFIMWRGVQLIAICGNCAEHTIKGLSRDVYELKGHPEAKGKASHDYAIDFLKTEVARLQAFNMKYSSRIVELQELLARQK